MKMNILVVDDEVVALESIRIGLENHGYRVVAAFDAHQALEKLVHGEHPIDLLLTDYLMPTMNGIELLLKVRERAPTLPVMIMTGYAETGLVIEALNNHCDGFVEKPFTLERLVAEIERIKLNLLQNTKSQDLTQFLPRIVHQINNPLTTISCFAQLIRSRLGEDETLAENVERILAAVKQIGCINKDIMNAGRAILRESVPVALESLLAGCLDMLHGLFIIKNVQVERKIFTHGVRVRGDKLGLEQVLNNLIINAVDAMDGCEMKILCVSIALLPDLESVELAIEDTGCGIREELLTMIFEPYYTDKRNGNGLGLEITKKIVERHEGKILVKSQVGIGSKFSIHLPVMPPLEVLEAFGAEGTELVAGKAL